jgi:hypothetical protein
VIGKPGGKSGFPYKRSKGLVRRGFWGREQSLSRARGRSFVQSRWSSRDSFVRVAFKVWLVCSTSQEDWGCKGYEISRGFGDLCYILGDG